MITIRAYAKLNLYLQITGSRVDGYHDLDMIMQSIDLHDTLRLSRAGDIQLTCSHPEVPLGESNIAHKAARRFFRETGIAGGVHADIQKRIPMAAGLGGGSADGAAMLRGLNCLYGYPLSERRLLALAAGIGADVPFSLTGGCRRAQGIGERLTSLRNQLPGVYLLLKPEGGV
ncbi:MAG: 4-(cytidine 5'-diphospho)-2-C-methyl-D-erythritol kinase, partial [Clostridiales bacterium]|nr:4-(cytidine 5'-diphospho)-2-C-methyl-D-erythritol kinase [Clostridiales bacterium]